MRVLSGCLLVSALLIPQIYHTQAVRACGTALVKIIRTVCRETGIYSAGSGGITFQRHHFIDKRSIYEYKRGEIVQQCCYSQCTYDELQQYCAPARSTTRRMSTPWKRTTQTEIRGHLSMPSSSLKARDGSAPGPEARSRQIKSAGPTALGQQSSGTDRVRLFPSMLDLLSYVSNIVKEDKGKGND